jgi:hypothetical protein
MSGSLSMREINVSNKVVIAKDEGAAGRATSAFTLDIVLVTEFKYVKMVGLTLNLRKKLIPYTRSRL